MIIKSKNFFHSAKRKAVQERKSNKAERLAEILQEQDKPTMAIFRVGGINVILYILNVVIATVAHLVSPSSTTVHIVTAQLIGIPIIFVQSLNNCLVYNIYS